MKFNRPIRRMLRLLVHTGTIKIFFAYVIILCVCSIPVWLLEPQVETLGDGLWFCFVASTTIGFGDITAVTLPGRLIVIFITICGVITVAMVPGVVVAYYTEYLKNHEKETISLFLEKLERLPELDKEELAEISEKVREYNKNH